MKISALKKVFWCALGSLTLGFYRGSVDGKMGPQTQNALGRYQIDKGFFVTCDLDARTWESLSNEY